MLEFGIFKLTLLAISMLLLSVSCVSGSDPGRELPLEVNRVKVIDSLKEAQSLGLRIQVLQYVGDAEVATVRVCKSREGLPDEVSGFLYVSLVESSEPGSDKLLMDIGQQMIIDESSTGYDLARFQIQAGRLPFVSLMLGYSYRHSGASWDGAGVSLSLSLGDLVEELTSAELTSYADFVDFSCNQYSGRYIYRP